MTRLCTFNISKPTHFDFHGSGMGSLAGSDESYIDLKGPMFWLKSSARPLNDCDNSVSRHISAHNLSESQLAGLGGGSIVEMPPVNRNLNSDASMLFWILAFMHTQSVKDKSSLSFSNNDLHK